MKNVIFFDSTQKKCQFIFRPVSAPLIYIIPGTLAEILSKLEKRCFEQGWRPEQIESELGSDGTIAFVAVGLGSLMGFSNQGGRLYPHTINEAEVRGYCLANVNLQAGVVEIRRLGVVPDARRQGWATKLITALEAYLAERGAAEIRILLEVAATNQAAIALYQKNGFQEISRRRNYYTDGSDCLVMGRGGVDDDGMI